MSIALIACIHAADSTHVSGSLGANDGPELVQSSMVRLNQIDWPLRRVAARDCRRLMVGTGIVLDSLLAYKAVERPMLRVWLGLGELPQITGIAAGSPGDLAGLAVGDRVVAIDGISWLDLMGRKGSQNGLPENVLQKIGGMTQSRPIRFDVERNGNRLSFNVDATAVCAGMIAVKTSRTADAFSDSDNIAVTTGMVSMLDTSDELAFIVGHEMAHIIFEDSKLHRISRVKKEERADLYGTFLVACAGFNPEGAISALGKLRLQARGSPAVPWIHKSFSYRQRIIRSFIDKSINCKGKFSYR